MNGGFVNFNDYFDIGLSKPEVMELLRDAKLNGDTITLLQKMADGTSREAHELRNLTELSRKMICARNGG